MKISTITRTLTPSALPAACMQSALIRVPAVAWQESARSFAPAMREGVLAGVGLLGGSLPAQQAQMAELPVQLHGTSGFAAKEYPTNDPTNAGTKAVKPAGGARGIPPRGRPV